MHRRLDTLICIVSLVFLAGALSIWWQGIRPSRAAVGLEVEGPIPGAEPPSHEPETPREPAWVVVHVGGAVKSPGVYHLREGQRVHEAISLAGPEEDADLDRLNLAALLKDSQRIIVPRKGESLSSGDRPPGPGGGYDPGSWPGDPGSGSGSPAYPLNVNTASARELETLPGIGPVLAGAIVDYREKCGPFERLEDLLNVSGIGEKILARISGYLVVE